MNHTTNDFIKLVEQARETLQNAMEGAHKMAETDGDKWRAHARSGYILNAMNQIDALLHIEAIAKK